MKKIGLVFCLVLFFSFSFQVSAQWHIIPSGTTNTLSSVCFINSDVGYISGGYGLIKITTNGGLDWVEQNSGTINGIKEIFFVDSLYGWACGNEIILKTTNGGVNWSPRVYTSDVIFYDIEFSDSLNGIVVGGGWNGNFFYELLKTTDGGVTWNAKYVPNTSIIQAVHFISDSCVFIAGWGGRIHKSTDGGNTWEMKSSAFSQRLSDIDFLDDSTGFIVGESGFIVKTTDSGETWTLLSSGVQDWLNAVFIVDPQVVFVVGNNGRFLKSSDFGQSWQQQFGLNLPHLHDVLLIDKMDGWIVGDGGTILKTENGGVVPVELTSFIAIFSNPNAQINWSTATELNNHGFEIERSLDKTSWVTIGFREGKGTSSEPQDYTYSDDISEISTSKIYYRLKQIDFDGSFEYSALVEVEITPTKFSLKQNYPNPFNPSTKISWQSPVSSWQTLKVYDILGNEVVTLVNEYKNAGSYEIEFNSVETLHATSLPSGVYFYRFKADEYVETKKMVLMK